jgi:hypothetical protein
MTRAATVPGVYTTHARWYTTKTHPSYHDMLTKLRRVLIAAQYRADLAGDLTPEQIHTMAWSGQTPQPDRETRGRVKVAINANICSNWSYALGQSTGRGRRCR